MYMQCVCVCGVCVCTVCPQVSIVKLVCLFLVPLNSAITTLALLLLAGRFLWKPHQLTTCYIRVH